MNINDGTQGALNILRDTVLASMPDDDWSDVLKSVSDAGGINDRLVPYQRLMLAKAVSVYNEGVAKGDFVGHPFRGNQHSSASGGGRGSAGGGPKRRSLGRVGASEQILGALNDELAGRGENQYAETLSRLSTPAIDELRSHIEQQEGLLEAMRDLGATSQVIGVQEGLIRDAKDDLVRQEDKAVGADLIARGEKAYQDKIKGNANAFAEAEMMVIGRIKDSFVDIEDSITNDRNGISNLVDASKSAIKQAEAKAEQSDAYGDNDSGDRDAATFVRRAEERVMQHAMDTSGLLTKVQDAVTKLRETMNDGSSINTTQTMVSAVMSQFKPLLQSQRSQLRDTGDFERTAVKQGFGSSGAVTRFAMLQRSVTNTMEQLNDISDASEGAGSDAEELSREILDSQ